MKMSIIFMLRLANLTLFDVGYGLHYYSQPGVEVVSRQCGDSHKRFYTCFVVEYVVHRFFFEVNNSFKIFKCSVTHILHVPNHNERTTEFRVESDLTCVSGPPSVTITGGDLVDYPLLVRPIRRGVVSGAVAFVAQAPGARNR